MVIVMKHHATVAEIANAMRRIESLGFKAHPVYGEECTIIGVIGDERPMEPEMFDLLPGVERTMRILHPFKFASRDSLSSPFFGAGGGQSAGRSRSAGETSLRYD